MSSNIAHFLLIYSLAERRLEDVQKFKDAGHAVAEYEKAERLYLGRGTHEVVLLGADSIEAIMTTHGAYFEVGADEAPQAGLTLHFSVG
jgi:hypothetical protein